MNSTLAAALALAAQEHEVSFQIYKLALAGTRHETVTYDFNGDGKLDIVNIAIDLEADPPVRWAFFYFQRPGGAFEEKPDRSLVLPDKAAALVFGDYLGAGAVQLGFLAPDGFYVYPPGNNEPVKLIHTAVFFSRPSNFVLPVWQYRTDLDRNGLDDLILPSENGYRIYLQTAKGTFGRVQELESPERDTARRAIRLTSRAFQEPLHAAALRYEKAMPRIEAVDIDGDGRLDLVSISQDKLTIFFQSPDGSFDPKRRQTRIVKTLSSREEAGAVDVAQIQFVDLDGDGLPELVVTKIEGQLGMVQSLQTNVYIHRGNGTAAFTPDQSLMIPGLCLAPTFVDLDGDGRRDMAATFVPTGVIQKALEAGVLGDVKVTTGFWRNSDKGFGPMEYSHEILVKAKAVEKRSAVPLVYVGPDLDGDGRPDMLVARPGEPLGVHRGRPHFKGGGRTIGFEPNPSITIGILEHPDWIVFHDMNGDGIADLQCLYSNGVTLAISRK